MVRHECKEVNISSPSLIEELNGAVQEGFRVVGPQIKPEGNGEGKFVLVIVLERECPN